MSWQDPLSDERMLRREEHRDDPARWSASSPRGVVSTAHWRATAAGVEMLARGGNAIDAAVAAALALGVVEPAASGLGGMAMMAVHLAAEGRTFCIEGPCRAPVRATPREVAGGQRKRTHRASAVPTQVATLARALRRYGALSEAAVLEPAIRVAREGFPVSAYQGHLIDKYRKLLALGPAAALLLEPDGSPLRPGTVLRQPALARTLETLAREGFEAFYLGEIGRAIVRDMRANGGFISAEDFSEVPWPREVEPLAGRFKGREVRTSPPPGGGSALLQLLHLYEALDPGDPAPDSAEGAALIAGLIRRVRLDRRHHPSGDVALGGGAALDLASPEYARRIAGEVSRELRPARSELDEEGETTHLCVMDAAGNVVSLTQSIERSFGAKVLAPELGFLYNGYLKTFKVKNTKHPYYLRPGAPARSNASPTIVLERGEPRVAIGSTGSERMVSGIFQVLLRLERQAPFRAVAAPRLHCTPEGEVLLEAARFSPALRSGLASRGYRLRAYDPWAFEVGGLQLAVSDGATFTGVADPRRDGAAASP